jgi:signal transduction histidine kinase
MAVIGQMTSVLAHEIRNAIGGVKGFTQWIDEKTEPSDRRKSALALVLKGTGRIETLVNDLLLYARNESYSIERINIAPLLDEAMTVATASWKGERESEFVSDVPALADREKLLRVLLNGMQNAVQAMGDEGLLRVSAKSSGRWTAVVIEDSGPGISPDVQEHLFSPFYTTKPAGTGLGLAYCSKAIGDMKGTITLTNRADGRGAALTIRLPAPP